MRRAVLCITLVLTVMIWTSINAGVASADCSQVTEIPQTECEALADFSLAFTGIPASWNTTGVPTPCTWAGVTCIGGNVVEIRLGSQGLAGSIPSTVENLSFLTDLDLSSNSISGSIPPEMGNLASLSMLLLDGNLLAGEVPTQLQNLGSINGIKFEYNTLYSANSALNAWISSWQASGALNLTQTTALTGLVVSGVTDTTVTLSWTAIPYTANTGRYQIQGSQTPSGPYFLAGITADKTVEEFTVTGLNADTDYYFVVRTITDPHANNDNTVVSEDSTEVMAHTDAASSSGGGCGVLTRPGRPEGPGWLGAVEFMLMGILLIAMRRLTARHSASRSIKTRL